MQLFTNPTGLKDFRQPYFTDKFEIEGVQMHTPLDSRLEEFHKNVQLTLSVKNRYVRGPLATY